MMVDKPVSQISADASIEVKSAFREEWVAYATLTGIAPVVKVVTFTDAPAVGDVVKAISDKAKEILGSVGHVGCVAADCFPEIGDVTVDRVIRKTGIGVVEATYIAAELNAVYKGMITGVTKIVVANNSDFPSEWVSEDVVEARAKANRYVGNDGAGYGMNTDE